MTPQRACGFTLIELLLALATLGILSAIALPTYSAVIETQKRRKAESELMKISIVIVGARDGNGLLPASLDGFPGIPALDPWGNPYQYLRIEPLVDPKDKNEIRKDHNLHPINSEFDLYSFGPDGSSNAPLTARASRDDILYARDGAFVGVAEDF